MRIEWNQTKNRANQAKHKVSFETASLVFDDPHHLSIQDRYEQAEKRWKTLGMIDDVVLLLVAHTFFEDENEEIIRIISARKATRSERQNYEQACQKAKD
jgi:uncharacterized DUF497 family protein